MQKKNKHIHAPGASQSGIVAASSIGGLHQQTIAKTVQCRGVGVHSGTTVNITLNPAEANSGIVFIRTDLVNGARSVIASWENVSDTRLCTVIANDHGGHVATIEHIMAALVSSGIDNVLIEIDGAEVPVMDGSAEPFIELINQAGIVAQSARRRFLAVTKPVTVSSKEYSATLLPAEDFSVSMSIDFSHKSLPPQSLEWSVSSGGFREEIGRARTFGFADDIEQMRRMGFGRGGSLENAIVIDQGKVLNQGGLRYADECVRHKILDAIGDLSLAGMPIRGRFEGKGTGHALNNQLLHALFADKSAFIITE